MVYALYLGFSLHDERSKVRQLMGKETKSNQSIKMVVVTIDEKKIWLKKKKLVNYIDHLCNVLKFYFIAPKTDRD